MLSEHLDFYNLDTFLWTSTVCAFVLQGAPQVQSLAEGPGVLQFPLRPLGVAVVANTELEQTEDGAHQLRRSGC